jgi:hypothetical protein
MGPVLNQIGRRIGNENMGAAPIIGIHERVVNGANEPTRGEDHGKAPYF